MRLRNWFVIVSTLALTACGSGIAKKGPQTLTVTINRDHLTTDLQATSSDQLIVEIKNTTDQSQVVRMLGLKINFTSTPIAANSQQVFHFQIDKNKGAINITTTAPNNVSHNTSVTIN